MTLTRLTLTLLLAGALAQQPVGRGFDTSSLDRSCQPCEDFFKFANGGWLSRNPVPAAYSSWGRFHELDERNRKQVRQILEDAAKSAGGNGGNEQKIGAYYASCMDAAQVEAAGLKPIEPELRRVEQVRDLEGLGDAVAHLQTLGVTAFFGFGAAPDFKESTRVIAQAAQGGLGLPDRDYYLKDDEKSVELRGEYVKHVARMLGLLGDRPEAAAASAAAVMRIETELARASMTLVERRDPARQYHKMSVAQAQELTPRFSWARYLKNIGLAQPGEINVAQPEFFKALDRQLAATPLPEWRAYLRWHLVNAAAPSLPARFDEADFDFYGKTLEGRKEQLPRWKRCVTQTNGALGEAVGQVYVARAFPPAAKARAQEMVRNLIAALREKLAGMDWMSPATRAQALAKIAPMLTKIGYPEKWRDYSLLDVERGAYLANKFRANRFELARQLAKVGKPVDRGEWQMIPPDVNAYYDPQINEIAFPAGILQPPFFDPAADDAVNYGGIGAVIGHELIHGFDDQGSQFDAAGNLKNWWTEGDQKNFEGRGACVEQQFSGFKVEEGLNVNGKLVLGESIADLGGLRGRLRGVPEVARGQAATGADRRVHRGAALLPRLGAGLGE